MERRMLRWADTLYLGESVRKEAGAIRHRLDMDRPDRGHIVITLASNGTDMLDLVPTVFLRQPALRLHLPVIVGLASSKEEAVGLVERMIGDSLRARGDADLRAYFRMKGVK
ncbi:hypothetical protein [Chordicoccus furentiruminis]|uniref:hypothetical protein n=1 Tax=Chordicoccus furentiruminis TaxID=2709410 RepID=UPI0023A8EA54|nr:hypothetical protein [Chordicoccus furentiruminis]